MLIPAKAAVALLDAGIHVGAADPGYVSFFTTVDGHKLEARAVVVSRVRTVGRSEVADLAPASSKDHLVLMAPTITEATQQYIEGRGWSWICVPRDHRPATGRLRFPGWDPVELGPREPEPGIPLPGKGRPPWARFAVIRQLLRGHAWTQTELARSGQVSQPRVSQILTQLTRDDIVGRFMGTGDAYPRWQAVDFAVLLNRWLATYPGPGGLATYWFGLDSITDQTHAALGALQRARPRGAAGDPVVSGDAAADYLAPYRRGHFSVVYSHWGVDLEDEGFTPTTPEEATLRLVVPDDWSVWPPPGDDLVAAMAPGAPFPIADPIQLIWDLLHGPQSDADQAAQAIERSLRNFAAQQQLS